LAASIAPGPAAGDDRVAGAGQRRADPHARRVVRVVGPGPGAAEHADRAGQLGEQTEALDELRLDPEHPPRVGVHPVGGTAQVEQPLVGRRPDRPRVGLAAAQHHRPRWRVGRGFRHRRAVGWSSCAASGQIGGQGVLGRLQPLDQDVFLTGVCELRVAGAVVDRRDAECGEAGDVGPAELGPGRAADGGTNAAAAGSVWPGSAPPALSTTVCGRRPRAPGDTSRTVASAASSSRSGA
jgi:hypothetical protein